MESAIFIQVLEVVVGLLFVAITAWRWFLLTPGPVQSDTTEQQPALPTGRRARRERLIALFLLGLSLAFLESVLVPLVGKILGTNVGEGVVGQIRLATDLNPWVEKLLLTLISVAATAIIIKFNLSPSANMQLVGSALIGLIWIAAYGYLAFKTSDPIEGPWFDTEGKPLRCYVLDSKGVRLLYLVERDPHTGRVCEPVNTELEPRLRRWLIAQRDAGGILQLHPVSTPSHFFGVDGTPQVWFYARKDGTCEYFDLPGVHPGVGVELDPITREHLARCRSQEEMRSSADKAMARRAKYVGVPVQRGSAIVATSELGPLASAALEAMRKRGHVVALKPAFVTEGLFDSVWNGGHELSTLGLEKGSGAVLLRPAGEARITRSPELEGYTSIQQAFSVLVIRPPYTVGVQSAAFTAEGLGFSVDTARAQFRSDFVAKLRSSLSDKF